MAAKENSSVQVQKNLEGFVAILTSAACEWFFIFLLLVDGLLSYLLMKFANYCNLQKPCIFCSRFEHVIGNEKPQLYQDLLCSNHISELSSWIARQVYGKHDGNETCEDSNPETHILLDGKSGLDLGSSGSKRSKQNRNFVHSSVGASPCSFCSRPRRPRENAQGLRRKSPSPKPNIPLPRFSTRSRLPRRDGSKKMRDKFPASVTVHGPGRVGWDPMSHVGGYTELRVCSDTDSARRPVKIGWDPLSHVGYTELKISSDTDSEFPFSDDDDGSSFISGIHEPKKEGFVVQCALENPFKAPVEGLNPAKQSNVSYKPKPSPSDPCVQPDGSKASEVKVLGANVAVENGFDDPNWQQASRTSNPSALAERISIDDFPPSSNVVEKNVTGTSDFGHASTNKNDELLKSISATDGESAKTDPIIDDPALVKPNHISVNVVSESAATGKEADSSGIVKEQPTLKEPDRVDGELKPLASQNSYAQESNLSSNNTMSGVNGGTDEKQVTDAFKSNPKPMLHASASVESGLESLDEGYVSEIEGESLDDRLKRQVEYYRKCIKELYKELEEERSASTIAANQAMAMITKLQEEKAAIHMEALQYLRMMEEQAEFDVDALEKANDLLAEKEKEIQDLEAELEFSKFDIPDETMENMPLKSSDWKGEIDTTESTVVACNSMDTEVPEASNDRLFSETTLLEFEDEKLYISNCLKSLERKLSEISCNGVPSNMPNGGQARKYMDDEPIQEETPRKERILLNGQVEENVVHGQKDFLHVSNRSSAAQEGPAHSESLDHEEKNDSDSHGQKDFMDHRETELVVLENEISDLNDRLEALETDHDFLEHMLYSLQNGNEGLRFVQDIAIQLRELRKIGTAFRCQSVS
ncbi:probable myosin-binding protein 4 isoform X2 [Prunus avium]|uniref:Probable myosin-binding protein 4 isoform X2 n=1 Tax=Prunus avium TaxID=42229 RepID=A0A6P5T3J5_PRUAV|nr:probable myosin-binding protein 4 isoform X2 [Prunus avium]